MPWQSFAQWKKSEVLILPENPRNETTDTHESAEAALGVIRLLQREGYGGDGRIFPVLTGVREV
jgi:hypothetical protein